MSDQDLERLVAATVRAVLEQLRAEAPAAPKGPLVRVLVSDTDRGLDRAVASLKAAQLACRFEYVLTSGTTAQVTTGYLRQMTGVPAVADESQVGCPRAWARGADVVVAATLDRPSALHVALTWPETFASKALFEALRRGRPTVIATDGFAWEAPEATPQLRAALAEPIGRLEVFGATCVAATELGRAVDLALQGPPGFNAARNRPLITAEDVEAAGGDLTLPADAVITPLALDRARELGVALHRVPH